MNQHLKDTLAEIERETMQRIAQLLERLMEVILRTKAIELFETIAPRQTLAAGEGFAGQRQR